MKTNGRSRRKSIRSILAGLLLIACLLIGSGVSSSAPLSHRIPPPTVFTQELQTRLYVKMQEMRVPGAVIFVQSTHTGQWTTSLGVSDVETKAPIRSDMHFRIGSITKTFTGTVILQLAQEGRLRLDDPVAKYQPGVPNGDNITLRELLAMRSGLYNYTADPLFNQQLDAFPNAIWTPPELLKISFRHPALFPPGTNFDYSNTNFILLGMIAEQITGHPIGQEFQNRIFKPLGMNNTQFPLYPTQDMPTPYTQGYMLQPLTSHRILKRASKLINATWWNPSWSWTAGSAISTIHDMQIWAKALATGQLLSPAMQKERLNWYPGPGGQGKYGLAIADFNGFIGHNGQIPGYQCIEGYMPGKNESIIVLTNLYAAPDDSLPADTLMEIIQRALAT